MPIVIDSEILVFTKDQFHTLAERVIGIVFGIHNDFGRLMNEDIYKQILRRRCEAAGIEPVRREVEITVSYQDFQKSFYMDLLLAHGLMVETKTVEQLTSAHEAQALHYLFLSGMRHGLLMNLRPGKVEKRFVSTSLDLAERRRVRVQDAEWNPVNEPSRRMREILVELLNDWGAFLQTSLYRDALVHFLGGKDVVLKNITIYDNGQIVGTHEVLLVAEDTLLAMTSLKDGKDSMSSHLLRFLDHTKLETIQWINLHNHEIELRTIRKTVG